MVRSRKHAPASIVLHQKVRIEVTEARFRPFESIQQLDVARLSHAAHARFEVGEFEMGCCGRMVHAIVRNGMVTQLEIEPCKDPVRMNPELNKVVQAVRKAFDAHRKGSTSLPIPVSKFLASPMGLVIEISGCFNICALGWCFICCFSTGDPSMNNCTIYEELMR